MTERVDTIVIGGGQAGLSVGYHLARLGVPFLILDAQDRVGGAWRNRWDSLRLFTPAKFDSLPGMPFPSHPNYFPTKNEMADYLASYAARFNILPVDLTLTTLTMATADPVTVDWKGENGKGARGQGVAGPGLGLVAEMAGLDAVFVASALAALGSAAVAVVFIRRRVGLNAESQKP